ncbi:MAG: hypothetical protein ACPKPY_14230 [Nitrososphaeraceae archaeon]
MSKIDDAMLKHMKKITREEFRSFTYNDFLDFEVDGERFTLKYGTIRNKFSELRKKGVIKLYNRSGVSFYTLSGFQFKKDDLMTFDHTYLSNNNNLYLLKKQIQKHPIYKILQYTQFGKRGIHDIHLTFEAKGFWNFLSKIEYYRKRTDSQNKSISFGYFGIENLKVQIRIQKTDTVTIIIGCSSSPIMLDANGVMRLTEVLTRVDERLAAILNDFRNKTYNKEYNPSEIKIPDKDEWKIVLWHLGRDSITQYSGEKFECNWGAAKNLFIRIYSKELKTVKKIRMEIQENPDILFKQLVVDFIRNSEKKRLLNY